MEPPPAFFAAFDTGQPRLGARMTRQPVDHGGGISALNEKLKGSA
jgi:hypothetical protein